MADRHVDLYTWIIVMHRVLLKVRERLGEETRCAAPREKEYFTRGSWVKDFFLAVWLTLSAPPLNEPHTTTLPPEWPYVTLPSE